MMGLENLTPSPSKNRSRWVGIASYTDIHAFSQESQPSEAATQGTSWSTANYRMVPVLSSQSYFYQWKSCAIHPAQEEEQSRCRYQGGNGQVQLCADIKAHGHSTHGVEMTAQHTCIPMLLSRF